jgi:hypothetical protein
VFLGGSALRCLAGSEAPKKDKQAASRLLEKKDKQDVGNIFLNFSCF